MTRTGHARFFLFKPYSLISAHFLERLEEAFELRKKKMATRLSLSLSLKRLNLTRLMQSTPAATRYFSDGKGRVLREEERAAENVYRFLSFFYHLLFGFRESFLTIK
ncbi:hypothetical protein M5689_001415 [Euphorbia peplus]|nr:hypothetical protein M5689_001415 [Euphorbia peplus]